MDKRDISGEIRDLKLLETLSQEPELKQLELAAKLGVAVGTVNWLLKRLAAKGYVKVKRIGQWRWRYLLTPQGVAEKARLTEHYLKDSMSLYRRTRREARELLGRVKNKEYNRVNVQGDEGNDLVDVCRLTCLEQGIEVVSLGESGNPRPTHSINPTNPINSTNPTDSTNSTNPDNVPILCVEGQRLALTWPTDVRGSNKALSREDL